MYSQYGQDFEISPSSGFVLLNIDVEKGTPATKIAPLMGLEARSLTRILKALEQKKWIIRKKDPLDGRLVRIFLTKMGREKRSFSSGSVKAFNKHILRKITEGELQSFLKVTAIVNEIASDKERIQEELQQLRNLKE
jgi:DNA-binding MarR family transcriptional regulator